MDFRKGDLVRIKGTEFEAKVAQVNMHNVALVEIGDAVRAMVANLPSEWLELVYVIPQDIPVVRDKHDDFWLRTGAGWKCMDADIGRFTDAQLYEQYGPLELFRSVHDA